jgi:hypothetical protein
MEILLPVTPGPTPACSRDASSLALGIGKKVFRSDSKAGTGEEEEEEETKQAKDS